VAGLIDGSPDPEQLGVAAQREQQIVDDVRAAIAQLPATQREVVEMHKLRGMSMADIATRLQVREGAVRVRAHRAYKALARLLEPKSLATFSSLCSSASEIGWGGWS
jgi:RNA polymerase sigma-70 factor (ECF subfamily)